MALQADALQALIVANLQAQGFDTSNPHAQTIKLAQAIAKGVVEHIQSSAVVVTPMGAGTVT